MAPTPAERKALLFLAAVGVLGGGVRMVGTGGEGEGEGEVTAEEGRAIARQLVAVDSASGAKRERKGARGARRSRARPADGGRARGRERDVPERDVAHDSGANGSARAGPVDVDAADAAALESLPGIGAQLAARIVADRAARGAFGSLEGLQRVRGIGPRMAQRLRAHVTFSGIPRLPDAAPRRAP